MRKVFAIAMKELQAFYKTPVAYVVSVITIGILNVFFYLIFADNREANFRELFQSVEFIFLFIVPVITMRTVSEEKSSGTLEFLMTTPTSPSVVVIGKYLGILTILFSILVIVPVQVALMGAFTPLDLSATWVGFGGIVLESAFFAAIGLWTSSLSGNQAIAAVSCYGVLFFLYFSMSFSQLVSNELLKNFLYYVSTFTHLENFASGILTGADVGYYVTGTAIALYLTRFHVDPRIIKD